MKALRQVSFAVLPLDACSDRGPERLIREIFRDVNTKAKPLNGGQILKAAHLGKISSERQAAYEHWRRERAAVDMEECRLDDLACLECLMPRKGISLEEFVDSDGYKAAWHHFGRGFMQAVQAILLKQDQWWLPMAEQPTRLEPFERLSGYPNHGAVESGGFRWRASQPLLFQSGEEYFQTANRFAQLYGDYKSRILRLMDGTHELGPYAALDSTLGELVCRAAASLASFMSRLKNHYSRGEKDELWQVVSTAVRIEAGSEDADLRADAPRIFNERLTNPLTWLGLQELAEPNKTALSSSYGGMAVGLFAAALCWCDHFGHFPPEPEEKTAQTGSADISRHFPALSEPTVECILRLLLCMMTGASLTGRYDSMLKALHLSQAVDAAQFTKKPEIALWKFVSSIRRNDGGTYRIFHGVETLLRREAGASFLAEADPDDSDPSIRLIRNAAVTYLSC